jgi:hypothetical protein
VGKHGDEIKIAEYVKNQEQEYFSFMKIRRWEAIPDTDSNSTPKSYMTRRQATDITNNTAR